MHPNFSMVLRLVLVFMVLGLLSAPVSANIQLVDPQKGPVVGNSFTSQ